MSLSEACASLIEALNARRTDILKSILDHLAKYPGDSNQVSLHEVLASHCTQAGTLLHEAVQRDQTDSVRALLLAGADPGIVNNEGKSVIALIVKDSLLQAFADELFRAIAASNIDRVKTLLDAGVKVDSVDSALTGNTALHWAASFGTVDVIAILLENGAGVNKVNSEGCTALHDAIQRGDEEIVSKLLESGADDSIHATGGKISGKTSKDLANLKPNILKLLDKKDTHNKNILEKIDEESNSQSKESINHQETKHVGSTVSNPEMPPLTEDKLLLLWPQPTHLHQLPGDLVTIPPHLNLVISHLSPPFSIHSLLDVWQTHRDELNELGHTASIKGVDPPGQCQAIAGDVEISLGEGLDGAEYTISITKARLRIRAGGCQGMHYAIYTLMQILWLFRGIEVPQLTIRDKPSMSIRGVLLDLATYGRIPTLETFTSTLHNLSRLKMNQVHLYMRLSMKTEWQLPFSENDLITMDRECHDRGIQLVPCIDIVQPCSLSEISKFAPYFSTISSCFSSNLMVHIGPCLSSVIFSTAAKTGPDSVFPALPSLIPIQKFTRIFFCSNSLTNHEELLDKLPSYFGLIEYGFQSNYPFLTNILERSRAGCPQILCPGTSAWNCLLGRPKNMEDNVFSAAKSASISGSLGVLVANWAGSPALAPLTSSLPGWTLGLGLAWNPQIDRSFMSRNLGKILTNHLLRDETGDSGQVLLDLGRAESQVECPKFPSDDGSSVLQTSHLLNVIMRPDGVDLEDGDPEVLGKVIQDLRRGLVRLQASREGGGGSGEGMVQEVTLSGELLLLAARLTRGLVLTEEKKVSALQATFRTDLANKLLSLIEQYRAVWLSRYQPGGMHTSLLHLNSLLNLLLPDHSHHAWTEGQGELMTL